MSPALNRESCGRSTEEDVLERRQLGPEVDDADLVLRRQWITLRHEIVAAAENRELRPVTAPT
jgi:hypothetical protein